jgi:phosphatidylglycerol:prolipoprotein diacylglycerol transferase
MWISFILTLILFISISQNYTDKLKSLLLVFCTSISAFFGARILHVLVERPELLRNKMAIFTHFDGMTYNGSLLLGGVTLYLCIIFLFRPDKRKRYWEMAAITAALSYSLMRLGCFSAGCCWGKPSATVWAVKYFNSQAMPWHGIPVHPVQLYESFLAFVIFIILVFIKFKNKTFQLSLFQIFLLLYSFERFFTEFFRGDSYRGTDVAFHLSTSQLVSIGIITIIVLLNHLTKFKNIAIVFCCSFILSGCLPHAPLDTDFRSVKRNELFEVYQTYKSKSLSRKNIIFLAGDDNIQFGFSKIIKAAYRTEISPRLEDIVFWQYINNLQDIYNVIVRIPVSSIGHTSLTEALSYMESLKQPYDLIILSHGMPNYLSTGTGYFFSYKEIDSLKGQLLNLNLVMLQSCFGESLANDFKEAGAKYILSYKDLNRNFFFYGVFLKYYYPGTSISSAYQLAIENQEFQLGTSIYDNIITALVKQQNQQQEEKISKSDYINSLPIPILE